MLEEPNNKTGYKELRKKVVTSASTRSAWKRGVLAYALEFIDSLEECGMSPTKENILNGAQTFKEYSEGGCALIYDSDIAERLCSSGEYKRRRGGDLPPNNRESWLDVQTRALTQAFGLIQRVSRGARP